MPHGPEAASKGNAVLAAGPWWPTAADVLTLRSKRFGCSDSMYKLRWRKPGRRTSLMRRPFLEGGAFQVQPIPSCIFILAHSCEHEKQSRRAAPARSGQPTLQGALQAAASAQFSVMSKLQESPGSAGLPSDEAEVPAAAAAASPPASGAAEQPQQQRVRLIRVKRKRGTDAPDDLGESSKMLHTWMAGLG